jgi:hypothetical protein
MDSPSVSNQRPLTSVADGAERPDAVVRPTICAAQEQTLR